MSKIGRNDTCPCGSGKKYKNCHSPEHKAVRETKLSFDDIVGKYNAIQILSAIGGLQLNALNHEKNFRLEQLARKTLIHLSKNGSAPLAPIKQLKGSIEAYTDGKAMEDPLPNFFTEVAMFEEGNYTVFPGIYEGYSQVLNNLLEAIFCVKNDLPEDFLVFVRSAAGLLLHMSHASATDSDVEPYVRIERDQSNLKFPDDSDQQRFVRSLLFPVEYLAEVCSRYKYEYSVLEYFIVDEDDDEEIQNDSIDENIVNLKPLIETAEGILMYMPTGVVHALVMRIYSSAEGKGCYDKLLGLMYSRQFHNTCVALSNNGWMWTDIVLSEDTSKLPIIETVFQFDSNKLAYVCYVKKGEKLDLTSEENEEADDPYTIRTTEVIDYLEKLDGTGFLSVFCVYVVADVGLDSAFSWSKPSGGHLNLGLTYNELWTICYAEKVDRLSLWKFAKCFGRTNELTKVVFPGGMLDVYAAYAGNDGSLLSSNAQNPIGGMLMIMPGWGDELRRQVIKRQDIHLVSVLHQSKRALARVKRYKDYAPIYVEDQVSEGFRVVIESYKMPIWIASKQGTHKRESVATWFCEAVVFWLYKMRNQLGSFINNQPLVQIEIEIELDKKMISTIQFERKDVDPSTVKLTEEVKPPKIKVIVPHEFLYLLIRPDNVAERVLMKSVLTGFVQYIHASGRETKLTGADIDQIVDTTLRPNHAKMILFGDFGWNIKMDDRKLPRLRFIKDTDVSFVLDNLVSYLPAGYIIPDEIVPVEQKIKLCNDIVTALIGQIGTRLKEFNGEELLQKLVAQNESIIQAKELREILIPAKIACYSDMKQEVEHLQDGEKGIVITGHSLRTLIEFVASKPPTGDKPVDMDDIDLLLALTNQVTQWGATSESMWFKLDDPKIGLLPSGRIGTEKSFQREYLDPYSIAKTESEIFLNIENFSANYSSKRGIKPEKTEETDNLDNVFKAECDITMTMLAKITGTLINEGFGKGMPFVQLGDNKMLEVLRAIEGVSENDIKAALALLVMVVRNDLSRPPPGYDNPEIYPWRYGRSLSYLRRPLIKITQNGNVSYLYGYRHLLVFFDNLQYLLHTAKFPNPKSAEMKSWLAGVSGEKGNPFRERVKEWFEKNSDFQVFPFEIKMEPNATIGHIKTDKSCGDIDLLVVDHKLKVIYSSECKNIVGGRNIHEMKVEMDDYLGRDGKDKNAKVRKHLERDQWLRSNKNASEDLVPYASTYTIKSVIITADEIPLAYLKKDDLPLPIKSFVFLRRFGISYLGD